MATRKNTIKTNIEANSEGFLKAMDEVQKSVKSTRLEFKNINSIMDGTSESTTQLISHKKTLQNELEKTKANIEVLNKGLQDSIKYNGEDSEATRIAREEVMKASTHYNNLKKELEIVNQRLNEQVGIIPNIKNALGKVSEEAEKFASKVKWLSVGSASLLALGAKRAIEYEDAFVGVAKTVDGTDEQLEQIRKDIIKLSENIPLATTEIFNLAEEAGQLGISAENLTTFTETMSKLASATNLTAEEAGSKLATFVNIMNSSADNYERIGSVIVQLGNHSKASEKDIVNMAERMVGAASTLKMSEPAVLGLATALSSVGLEAEMGGTAISRIMNDFNRAASGVETKYGSLSLYAKICGMSTKQFAKTVKNDAGTAIKEFIAGLGNTNRTGSSTIKLMEKLGINEVRLTDTMLRLSNASGLVGTYLNMANQEWKDNNALNEEASRKFADTQSQVEIFKNKVNNLVNAFGENLLPSINDILDGLSDLVKWFGSLDDKQKKLIISVTEVTALLYPVAKGISKISTETKGLITFTSNLLKPYKNLVLSIKNADSSISDFNSTLTDTTINQEKNKKETDNNIVSLKKLDTTTKNTTATQKKFGQQLKDGIDNWQKSTSGVDKLKVGLIGLAGTTTSLLTFSKTMKDIREEGANFSNVAGSITTGLTTIASAASTGASIGGAYGAVIGGIEGALLLAISSLKAWNDVQPKTIEELEKTKSTFEKYKSNIDSIKDSFDETLKSTQDNVNTQTVYIDTLKELSTELGNVMDSNGKVKDSDIERAEVITTLLNEGLGTQLTLEDGVIKNGDKIVKNKEQFIALVDKSIEATKKEILFQSYQSEYKSAIEAQSNAKKEYNDALSEEAKNIQTAIDKYKNHELEINDLQRIVNESSKAKKDAEKQYQDVLKNTNSIVDGLKDVMTGYKNKSVAELEEVINKITSSSHQSLDEVTNAFNEAFASASKMANDSYNEIKKSYKEPIVMNFSSNFANARNEVNRFVSDYNKCVKVSSSNNSPQVSYFPKLSKIPANAEGDIVTRPSIRLVGEDGPEVIMPLEKHTNWINKVASGILSGIVRYYKNANNSISKGINNSSNKINNSTTSNQYLINNNKFFNISNISKSSNALKTLELGIYKDINQVTVGNNEINNKYLSNLTSNSYTSNLENIVNLLEKILSKPNNVFLNGEKISEATASSDNTISGRLMEETERGWIL